MKVMIKILATLLIVFLVSFFSYDIVSVQADDLSENIEQQISNLDLSELDAFLSTIPDRNLFSDIFNILQGKYDFDLSSLSAFLFSAFFRNISDLMPLCLSILSIAIFCGIMQGAKSSYVSESVSQTVFSVCFLATIVLIGNQFLIYIENVKNIIQNISKFNEIISPIILTLMIASGGNVSATIYQPSVVFMSEVFINSILFIILPLIECLAIFSAISNFSKEIKLNKFCLLFQSIIKWIIGILITIYGVFLSVGGISGASFDGISLKATKYAISNSIPIVGGFLRDGFDLVVAGSVLIKNAIGVIGVVTIFYIIISPLLSLIAFSIILKLISALSETVSDSKISELCMSFSKSITYIIASLLSVGFMLFITILLMIVSANAFI